MRGGNREKEKDLCDSASRYWQDNFFFVLLVEGFYNDISLFSGHFLFEPPWISLLLSGLGLGTFGCEAGDLP